MDVISFKRLSLSFKRLSSRNFLICVQALFTHSAEVAALWDSIIAPSTSPHFRSISPTSSLLDGKCPPKLQTRWLVKVKSGLWTKPQDRRILAHPVVFCTASLSWPNRTLKCHFSSFTHILHFGTWFWGPSTPSPNPPPLTSRFPCCDHSYFRLILFLLETQPFPSL